MTCMFDYTASFNRPIGNWSVSSVTCMPDMFHCLSSFNQPVKKIGSSVPDMNYMFWGTQSFNQPIGNWNVSSATAASFK
jgi:hypothetical protein